jgi:lysophospholipase L1-like esterase
LIGLFGAPRIAPQEVGPDAREGLGAPAGGALASRVRWLGRVDTSNVDAPRFSWSYSGFVARFSGTALSVQMANDGAYFFQAIVDGCPSPRFEASSGIGTYALAAGLPDGEHTIELHRETEGKYGDTTLLAVEGTLLDPPSGSGRLIEVIGDSISAGYGSLGVEHHAPEKNDGCHFSYATESAFDAYAAKAARALDADLSVVALSGWGVFRDKDHATTDAVPGVYERSLADSATPVWDFRTRAQAVIINLGTNDFTGPAPFDPGKARFTKAYRALLENVRHHHPGAWIFCALGPLLSDAYPPDVKVLSTTRRYLNSVIDEVQESGDHRISLLEFPEQDKAVTGCDWHPGRAEHERMADLTVAAMKDKLDW